MESNAYSRILSAVREKDQGIATEEESLRSGLGAADMRVRLGIVTQRVPLLISVAGIVQPTGNLRIDERLTKGAMRKVKLTSPCSDYRELTGALSGPVSCPGGTGSPRLGSVTGGELHSENSVIDKADEELLEIDLEVNDQVLVLTEDDQIFYILCKVVNAV